jgi:hypothetical protein
MPSLPGRSWPGHRPAGDGEAPRVSITDLKRWQASVPVVISADSVIATTLAPLLVRSKVPVSVVQPSGLPDITIGKGLAIKVLTLANVANVSMDSTIFAILDQLRLTYEQAFLVAWDDGTAFDEDITKEMVVDWLERFAEPAGVRIIATSSVDVLAVVIRDFHEHVLASATVAKCARRETLVLS